MEKNTQKIAIVTGGASGIGQALCLELSKKGIRVIVTDKDLQGAKQTAQTILNNNGDAEAYAVDVTSESEIVTLVQQINKSYGRLDFMFNNAGIGLAGEIAQLTSDKWKPVIEVNLFGVLYGCQAAYKIMSNQGYGKIVNIASSVGLLPSPFFAYYSASKFAVLGFTEALRAEAIEKGVSVYAVCPGHVATQIIDSSYSVGLDIESVKRLNPFPLVDPLDAAKIILAAIDRNKSVIIFPFYVSILLGIYRFIPRLSFFFNSLAIRKIREKIKAAETGAANA